MSVAPPLPAPTGQRPRRLLILTSERARRRGLFIAVAALTYAGALLALMPASAALRMSGAPVVWSDAAGSAWDGEVALRDRARVGWASDPLRSLGVLALAGDLRVEAPATELDGRFRLRPGAATAENVSGTMGWALISALAPDAPVTCDLTMDVRISRAAFGGGEAGVTGRGESAGGTCAATRGFTATPAPVPALTVTATSNAAASTIVLAPRDNRSSVLAQAVLARGGRLSLSVTPAGAALVPGAFLGSLTLETQL